MPLIVRYAVRSDLGLVRTNNEDSVYAGPRLLAIADGMGGHAAGEVASKIVIGTLEPLDEDRSVGDLIGTLREAVTDANRRIAEAVEKQSDLEGMGTTLTALRFSGNQVGVVHVGDSRAYMLRGDLLSQITHDDTYVQYLVDSGKITPDEAKEHPRKSVILRALLGTDVEPDVSIREARAGDRYLLCTDGLTDVVSTDTLADTLRITDPQEAADRLVELALRGGGPDNVTVIVADVVQAGPGDFADDVPVIAGAFVDPAGADGPGDDSPAGRAARIGRAASGDGPIPPVHVETRRRRRWRGPAILIGAFVVVFGGLLTGYEITQSYYFVGKDGSEVAIYRGVNTEFGPIKFFNVYKSTGIQLTDLTPSARSQVNDGITANSVADAQQIVRNLQAQLLPVCVTVSTTTPSPTATPPKTSSSTSSAHSSKSLSPSPTPSPTATSASPTQIPYVDCRPS